MTDGLSSSKSLSSSKGLVDAVGFPGAPDGFLRLWMPHRTAHVSGTTRPKEAGECPFCVASSLSNAEALITARDHAYFALPNLYPYSSDHILVCIYHYILFCTDLTDEERVEIGSMTARAMKVLDEALRPAGFNLGMNQGGVASAGITTHIHQHVVPGWLGNTNSLSVIAQTKIIPAILVDTRNLISKT